MANDKEYSKRSLVGAEEEMAAHKKKSKTSSKSASKKRSNHRHDYERVIIESGFSGAEYYWAKRCRICGRVDDSGLFKEAAMEGLVKRYEKAKLKESTYLFRIFYSSDELKNLFPDTAVLKYNYDKREYEEVKR